jgi:DNA repair exonuclease SbcCD ATPase subunit
MHMKTRAKSAVSTAAGLLAAIVGGLLFAGPRLAAQNPPPAQKPVHAKKVWTEDDLVALRTPTDIYQRDQERKAEEARAAQEAEDAAQKAAAAQAQQPGKSAPAPAAGRAPVIPTRLDEVRQRIEIVTKQVGDLEFELHRTEEDLLAAREDQKLEVDGRRADVAARLDRARAELQALQDKLRELQPSAS